MTNNEGKNTKGKSLREALREIWEPFLAFVKAPRPLWGINIPYLIEGLVYFGILTVLAKYLSENLKLGDVRAGIIVSLFTGGITFAMFFLGETADRKGIRKVLLASFSFMLLGRILLGISSRFTPTGAILSIPVIFALLGLFSVVVGYGMYQPGAYAGVKKFTDEKTATMGYAMLYALMNLGAFFSGMLSPVVRRATQQWFPPNGIGGVLWVYVGFTSLSLLLTGIILSSKDGDSSLVSKEKDKEGKEREVKEEDKKRVKLFSKEWFKGHPLADARFSFFIFILIPVQTLFAHNWLTLPLYINRAFVPWVSENFEFFSNLNPILIFILAPLVAALTAKKNIYNMIIYGTFVMALPTFLLAIGPYPPILFTYIVLMTIGEAMWQPRFLQFIAEIAPEGKTGSYMGIGQFPWFLTKVITGLYSGWFLQEFVPAEGPQRSELLWFIYGCISIISPIALVLAKKWMLSGEKFKSKEEQKLD